MTSTDQLLAILDELAEYFEDRVDVVDGPEGQPVANEPMRLLPEVLRAKRIVENLAETTGR